MHRYGNPPSVTENHHSLLLSTLDRRLIFLQSFQRRYIYCIQYFLYRLAERCIVNSVERNRVIMAGALVEFVPEYKRCQFVKGLLYK